MNLTLRTFVVLMLGLHVTEAAAVAADRANWAPEAGQSEPVIPGTRVQPPTADDLTFVYDVGQGLDTNCLYHSEGPIVITLPISRVVGDVSKQVDANLNPTAELLIAAYDVDSDASIPPLWPERDRIRINGHVVPGEFLTGFNEAWKINAFPIPIEWLHCFVSA